MDNIKTFRTPVGTFVQMHWDGFPNTFKEFLKLIGDDFFDDGWGYDTLRNGIYVPAIRDTVWLGSYLCCCTDRSKSATDRYSVNSMDIEILFRKI